MRNPANGCGRCFALSITRLLCMISCERQRDHDNLCSALRSVALAGRARNWPPCVKSTIREVRCQKHRPLHRVGGSPRSQPRHPRLIQPIGLSGVHLTDKVRFVNRYWLCWPDWVLRVWLGVPSPQFRPRKLVMRKSPTPTIKERCVNHESLAPPLNRDRP
jgi:hypothetical protein